MFLIWLWPWIDLHLPAVEYSNTKHSWENWYEFDVNLPFLETMFNPSEVQRTLITNQLEIVIKSSQRSEKALISLVSPQLSSDCADTHIKLIWIHHDFITFISTKSRSINPPSLPHVPYQERLTFIKIKTTWNYETEQMNELLGADSHSLCRRINQL